MGDIKGKDIYIVDDMICTGGTLSRAIEEANKMGVKSITAVCTLSLLNGPAKERFEKAYNEGMLKMVIGTDATYQNEEFTKNCKWFKQLSVADYFADTIDRINRRNSITDLL